MILFVIQLFHLDCCTYSMSNSKQIKCTQKSHQIKTFYLKKVIWHFHSRGPSETQYQGYYWESHSNLDLFFRLQYESKDDGVYVTYYHVWRFPSGSFNQNSSWLLDLSNDSILLIRKLNWAKLRPNLDPFCKHLQDITGFMVPFVEISSQELIFLASKMDRDRVPAEPTYLAQIGWNYIIELKSGDILLERDVSDREIILEPLFLQLI